MRREDDTIYAIGRHIGSRCAQKQHTASDTAQSLNHRGCVAIVKTAGHCLQGRGRGQDIQCVIVMSSGDWTSVLSASDVRVHL